VGRYDDAVFKNWVTSAYEPRDVQVIDACELPDAKGVRPGKLFTDLCTMSEDFVRSQAAVEANYPLHERMLLAVRQAVIALCDGFQRDLSRRER
jgi:hypothetical protein